MAEQSVMQTDRNAAICAIFSSGGTAYAVPVATINSEPSGRT